MARRRMIDPNFWCSPDVRKLTHFERLVLIGMISNADDYGKGFSSPNYIRSIVFPYEEISKKKITIALGNIGKHISVQLYEVNGAQYYKFKNWDKWQTVSHKADSKIPEPLRNDSGIIPESIRNHSGMIPPQGKGREGKGEKLRFGGDIKEGGVGKEVTQKTDQNPPPAPQEHIQKLCRTFDGTDRPPLEKDKEAAVKAFKVRFPGAKGNLYGLMHNILAGEREYRPLGPVELNRLIRMIRLVPQDLKDPVARLTHIALNPNEYEVDP